MNKSDWHCRRGNFQSRICRSITRCGTRYSSSRIFRRCRPFNRGAARAAAPIAASWILHQHSGIVDERGRLMVVMMHNTDIPDGWERKLHPLSVSPDTLQRVGINIVLYAMTH